MTRVLLAGLLALAAAALVASGQASAATVTVCPSGCAFSQIAPAVAAAKDGDTIAIAAGSYTGGVTLDVSVKLEGSGAGSPVTTPAGPLTFTKTTSSIIRAGRLVASDGGPGGIASIEGGVALKGSTVTGNQAIASAPNGRFAETGGVDVGSGTAVVDGSLISGNSASISTAMPNDIPDGIAANAGGLHIRGDDNCASPGTCAIGKIRNSTITGNTVTASNSIGDAVAFCGGTCDDGQLALSDSLVSNNHVTASVPAG